MVFPKPHTFPPFFVDYYILATFCKYSPCKLAALYAIELLHNKDEKKALQLYEELQTHKDMFYIPGLMTTALSIVEQIKQGCNKRL